MTQWLRSTNVTEMWKIAKRIKVQRDLFCLYSLDLGRTFCPFVRYRDFRNDRSLVRLVRSAHYKYTKRESPTAFINAAHE